MSPKLEIIDLEKYFAKLHILKGISLNAMAGDIIVLLGSSGSGKSTLLRCINLLELPSSGEIKLDGIKIYDQQNSRLILPKNVLHLRKKIGMVFQQFNLWPHMSILENLITAPICVFNQPRKVAVEYAKLLLNKVGIVDKADSYPLQLSGGQQQRVAIARGLMMNPEIMLFDEPTSALDPEMTNEVLKVIQSLANEGMTMLIATHEIGFAKEVANRALFLEQGKIVEEGVAKEMLNNPQTARLQQFLKSVSY
ncbi:MAG TPA: amino acid ABC transporter ATP-binding protein [Burkholderiales bacterium]|nr:amino acid ABC transporter ATP-binding protein [Burkholderiales bacterium]